MNITSRHWLAGFLEGEGSFLCGRVHGGKKAKLDKSYLRLSVAAVSVDLEVLERCRALAGGRITGPYERGHQATWNWHLSRMKEAVALMEELRPLMGGRRQAQIDRCLSAYAAKTEIPNSDRTHCPKGHPYDEANTYVVVKRDGRTSRQCRICRGLHVAAFRKAHPEETKEIQRRHAAKKKQQIAA